MNKKLFFVIAQKRSGTTAFRACLNATKNVFEYGEILYPSLFDGGFYSFYSSSVIADRSCVLPQRFGQTFRAFIDARASAADASVVGFDIKYTHLETYPELIKEMAKGDSVAIHLVRENLLENYISHRMMELRVKKGLVNQLSVHTDKSPELVRFPIDPDTIAEELEKRHGLIRRYHGIIQKYFSSVLYLTYESLFQRKTQNITKLSHDSASKIEDILGVSIYEEAQTELIKQNPYGTHNVVINYSDVSKALSNTRFAHMAR